MPAQASLRTAPHAECGIKTDDIRTLARWMADADPLVIAPGNGLERGRNGGSGIRAAIALPALLGRLQCDQRHRVGSRHRVRQQIADDLLEKTRITACGKAGPKLGVRLR